MGLAGDYYSDALTTGRLTTLSCDCDKLVISLNPGKLGRHGVSLCETTHVTGMCSFSKSE